MIQNCNIPSKFSCGLNWVETNCKDVSQIRPLTILLRIFPIQRCYLSRPYCVYWTIKPVVHLSCLSLTLTMWFVTRPHSWRCLVTQRLSPVYCGWIKARCAVQAGITPFECGTFQLELTNRRWYVCAGTILDFLKIKLHRTERSLSNKDFLFGNVHLYPHAHTY